MATQEESIPLVQSSLGMHYELDVIVEYKSLMQIPDAIFINHAYFFYNDEIERS